MKLLFTTLSACLLTSTLLAQHHPQKFEGKVPKKNFVRTSDKTIYYNEDFGAGMGNWTTSGVNDTVWQLDFDGPTGEFSSTNEVIQSTTAANGFMIFDADKANTPLSPNYIALEGNLISPVIDLSAAPKALAISYEYRLRFCCEELFTPWLEVSTDGFQNKASYDVKNGLSVNNSSGTILSNVIITGFLDTASNLHNFQFRFVWDGSPVDPVNSSGTSHYFWQLDDIRIETSPDRLIEGFVFKDVNSNCTNDQSTDLALPYIALEIKDLASGLIRKTTTDINGHYQIALHDGTYLIQVDTNQTQLRSNCGQAFDTIVLDLSDPVAYFNYALDCQPITSSGYDAVVVDAQAWSMRPGSTGTLCVSLADQVYNPYLPFNCSSNLSQLDSIQVCAKIWGPVTYSTFNTFSADSIQADTIWICGTANSMISTGYIDFCFLLDVDTTANLTDFICIDLLLIADNNDVNLKNNHFTQCFQIVNSYDPNHKDTWPMEMLPGYDEEIRYTVQFQNLGTAEAINIRVLDTLDQQIDPASFKLLESSHAVETYLNDHLITWKFKNINLPDSTSDPEGSNGYVTYSVRSKQALQLGDTIRNTAYIYFDYNDAVVTNTSLNICKLPDTQTNSIKLKQKTPFQIYPNPIGENNIIYWNNNDYNVQEIKVRNLNGQLIQQIAVSPTSKQAELKLNTQGIYLIEMQHQNGLHVVRLVK